MNIIWIRNGETIYTSDNDDNRTEAAQQEEEKVGEAAVAQRVNKPVGLNSY